MRPAVVLLLAFSLLIGSLPAQEATTKAPASPTPASSALPAAAADSAPAGIVISADAPAPQKADLTQKEGQAVLTVKEEENYIEGKIQSVPVPGGTGFQSIDVIVAVLDEYDNEVKITYHVVPDANGQRLARELTGKIAEVTCQIQNRATREKPDYWITVRRFVPVDEATN